ncbi:alpha/beta hydrolase [Solihabitans fulvus]|uniref:Alpha/beta hydrolase n=1 Tax=Solihabitans fulvus TaxID=1892852 RepID=A0A5B2XTJ1_9PSEU|nr:alpha/beta hydrolase [Solihabitans fulvus]KAA2266151.1 alpha/beta hydrolase [Solihabitans fulvus]
MNGLRVRRGGSGGPTLLLLHGLGATGGVWRGLTGLLDDRWPGGWLAPDLPGHGGSDPLPRYTYGHLAAAVASAVEDTEDVVVLGHSLGGVVGLALASGWFGPSVRAVCGLGIKVSWTQEELAKSSAIAAKPARTFPSRAEAAARCLAVAGLTGLVAEDAPEVDEGLVTRADGWGLALDQAAYGVGAPPMPGLLAAARATGATLVLAAGERDPMCAEQDLAALVDAPVVLAGLGHNAHVESPEDVLDLVLRVLG